MMQKHVTQKEFDDFVLTIVNTIPKKEDLAAAEERLSMEIKKLESKTLNRFDDMGDRLQKVEQGLVETNQRLGKVEQGIGEILREISR